MSKENYGRRPETKWPGLEKKRNAGLEERLNIYSRLQELNMEKEEALAREEEYASLDVDIDFDNLKFSCEAGEKHTTIDFDNINDESQRVRVTTNDYVVYNRIKKLMNASDALNKKSADGEAEWLIEDIKLNRTKSAVFFITVTCPLSEIKKIFNKYIQTRHK